MVKLSVSSIIALSAAATVLSAPIPNFSNGQDAYKSSKTPCTTGTADQLANGYTPPSTPLPYVAANQLPEPIPTATQLNDGYTPSPSSTSAPCSGSLPTATQLDDGYTPSPTSTSAPCSGSLPTATQLNDVYTPSSPNQVVESVQSDIISPPPSSVPCSDTIPTATQLNDVYSPSSPTPVVEVQSEFISPTPTSTPCSGTATQLNNGYTPVPQGPSPKSAELPDNISPPSTPSVPAPNLDYGYEGNMSPPPPPPSQDIQSDYGIKSTPSDATLPSSYQPLIPKKKKKCVRKVRKCKPRRPTTGTNPSPLTPTNPVDAFNPTSTNVPPPSNDYSYGSDPAPKDYGKKGAQGVSPASIPSIPSNKDYSYGSAPVSKDYGKPPNPMGYAY